MEEHRVAVVGQRVRHLRRETGKSLRTLADELGISASSLSMLENSRGGVSLARLQLVARHFGLPVTDLLAEPVGTNGDGGTPEVFRGAELPAGVSRGHGTRYQLLGSPGGHHLQAYVLTFQPGGGYGEDAIGHPGEEYAHVVFGDVELLHGEQTVRLLAGDSVRFRTETPHAFRNASQTAVAIVVGAATPPW